MSENVLICETDAYKVILYYKGEPVDFVDVVVEPKMAGYRGRAGRRQRAWEPNEPHSDLPGTQELQL